MPIPIARHAAVALLSLGPMPALAQEAPDDAAREPSGVSDVPSVATTIVLRDVTLTLGEARIDVLLTPDQVERLSRALGSGASIETKGDPSGDETPGDASSDDG